MSTTPGLPVRGSDVNILITRVHLHPLCSLVEFWGKFSQENTVDYECLAKDIQSPENTFQEFEGGPGDQCLVQTDGIWNRARIVSRNGSRYSVFLIDKGVTSCTTASQLAWGKKKHFHLPPEVEFCVLANVLPYSTESRWSPGALEFLRSLSGKSLKAHVQDVLVPYRTFLLHVPCISKQMYEMGFAKKLSPDVFQEFVLMSLKSKSAVPVSPEIHQTSLRAGVQLHMQDQFMVPEIPAATVEAVIVTEVSSPQRIFCQLKVFSQELEKLSEKITKFFEGRKTNCNVSPEMIGFPCAARGNDGRWRRSVLEQVFPANGVVEVMNIDYGTKQFVPVENVGPLASEFFRMPVVTYMCSLHGIIDKGVGWTSIQIDHLRNLLLHKTVIAKFEYQSMSEGVNYVTLFGDENRNINKLFGSKEHCLLECEKTLGDYAIRSPAYSREHQAQQDRCERKTTSAKAAEEKDWKGIAEKLPSENLSLNSSHVALVQHVTSPSEFWIQNLNYANELHELMDRICHSENNDVVMNPAVGLYCAAKAKDGVFYRAIVSEIGETQVKVFFVDFGNTEVVKKINIRTLPDEFKKLPRLALKCTLADVRPTDGRWSLCASEYFIKAVTDKPLNVRVKAKYDDVHVVQLTDPEAHGERDLSSLMRSYNLTEKAETQRWPNVAVQPAIVPPTPDPRDRLADVYGNKGIRLKAQNTVSPAMNERRIPTFKEHMFPIGSVLDVSVSHIKSPNDFWCQLVHSAGHLKLLMHEIQAHYAGVEVQPFAEMPCIARHPDNRMWYRAIVIHKHEKPLVDVLFVDYGQTETVSLYDLRKICPKFLTLPGQAFRCSLLNPIDPTTAINEWNQEATARFHNFVETAASDLVVLKCTIYAVMYSDQRVVFNIVDLETPFESICTTIVNLAKSGPPKKVSEPSVRLDSYYYSTHNIKTGTEEQIAVTCVNSVNRFYCQLERNADVMEDLKCKVSSLCHQLENVKLPTVIRTLCFAKYTDGQWYRGQIQATKPAILVHFVDYGDIIEVDQSDLLPVPLEANAIVSVPVQAVVCGLSDVPANVPSEVNSWFEKCATESKFKAVVVAREPDGKLLVELYQGNTQLNSEIKKRFQIAMHTDKRLVYQKAFDVSANNVQKPPNDLPKPLSAPKTAIQIREECKPANRNLQSAPMPLRYVDESGQRIRSVPIQLYKPPHQRQSCATTLRNMGNGNEPAGAVRRREENLPTDTDLLIESKSPCSNSQIGGNVEKLPKLADLPTKSITPDMEADVYVSHYNSPLSFHVQLIRDENEIFSISEKLNDSVSVAQTSDVKDVNPGDVVQAEFAGDSMWYRAVVREIHGNTKALVEFIDFGNTAVTQMSKLGRLHTSFLLLPQYSTHCMLGNVGKEDMLDPQVLSSVMEAVGADGDKKLKCRFIRQSGCLWEVSLEENGVNVISKAHTKSSVTASEFSSGNQEEVEKKPVQPSEEQPLNPCPLQYGQLEILEEQQLQSYIATINNGLSFWCQCADTEKLDKITSDVSEVGNAADHKHVDQRTLSPGRPCIALFSEDHLWYRATVIDTVGDKLSVLFVDYGNKSQVSVTDVREMPPHFVEAPPQAFLCELDGFDSSHGSWDSGAVDELFKLTTDQLLQLTVTRVTRDEESIKYMVRMECDGQVINEVMKNFWKDSTMERKQDACDQCDSSMKEADDPRNQETDPDVACIQPETEQREEILLPANSDRSHLILNCDEDVCETDKASEEEVDSAVDIVEPDDMKSPLDWNREETMDVSEIRADLESSAADMSNTGSSFFSMIDFDQTLDRDDVKSPIPSDRSPISRSTVKMVPREALCPRKRIAQHEVIDLISTDLEQIQTELLLPSPLIPAQLCDAPKEQEIATGGDVIEVPCIVPGFEIDLMTEDKTSSPQEDTDSDPHELSDDDKLAGKMEEDVASLNEKSTMKSVPEHIGSDVEDDLHTTMAKESNEVESESLGAPSVQEIASGHAGVQDEVVPMQDNCMTEDETSDIHEDKIPDLSCDTKPQSFCQYMSNLDGEMACLLGESCLADDCRGQRQQTETDTEQLMCSAPEQRDVRGDSVIIPEACADDLPDDQRPE